MIAAMLQREGAPPRRRLDGCRTMAIITAVLAVPTTLVAGDTMLMNVTTTAMPTASTSAPPALQCFEVKSTFLCNQLTNCYWCPRPTGVNTSAPGFGCVPNAQRCPYCDELVRLRNRTCDSLSFDCTFCYTTGQCNWRNDPTVTCASCESLPSTACAAVQKNTTIPGPRCAECALWGGTCVPGDQCRCRRGGGSMNASQCASAVPSASCHFCALGQSCQNATTPCATCSDISSLFMCESNEAVEAGCAWCATTATCMSATALQWACPSCAAVTSVNQCEAAYNSYDASACQWCESNEAAMNSTCWSALANCPNQGGSTTTNTTTTTTSTTNVKALGIALGVVAATIVGIIAALCAIHRKKQQSQQKDRQGLLHHDSSSKSG